MRFSDSPFTKLWKDKDATTPGNAEGVNNLEKRVTDYASAEIEGEGAPYLEAMRVIHHHTGAGLGTGLPLIVTETSKAENADGSPQKVWARNYGVGKVALFVSTDDGQTFPDAPIFTHPTWADLSPIMELSDGSLLGNAQLIAGNSQSAFYRSTDGGATWTGPKLTLQSTTAGGTTLLQQHSWFEDLNRPNALGQMGPLGDGRGVILAAEYGDKEPTNPFMRLFESRDYGETWTEIYRRSDIRHWHCIQRDPYNPQYLWVNAGDTFSAAEARLGYSTDNGRTWTWIVVQAGTTLAAPAGSGYPWWDRHAARTTGFEFDGEAVYWCSDDEHADNGVNGPAPVFRYVYGEPLYETVGANRLLGQVRQSMQFGKDHFYFFTQSQHNDPHNRKAEIVASADAHRFRVVDRIPVDESVAATDETLAHDATLKVDSRRRFWLSWVQMAETVDSNQGQLSVQYVMNKGGLQDVPPYPFHTRLLALMLAQPLERAVEGVPITAAGGTQDYSIQLYMPFDYILTDVRWRSTQGWSLNGTNFWTWSIRRQPAGGAVQSSNLTISNQARALSSTAVEIANTAGSLLRGKAGDRIVVRVAPTGSPADITARFMVTCKLRFLNRWMP